MLDNVKNIIKWFTNVYKKIVLKSDFIVIESGVSFNRTQFSKYNKIYQNCIINDATIGAYTYIQKNCILSNTNIGAYTSIGPNVEIIYGTHATNFVSTNPVFYSTRLQCGTSFVEKQLFNEFNYVNGTQKSLIIGNDVWIGYGTKIIEGVTIHDGAIVLAGAVVTKDVDAYSIVGGVPTKHIKYRFNLKQIELLKKFQWWNKDEKWIKDNVELFSNIEAFFDYIQINNANRERIR